MFSPRATGYLRGPTAEQIARYAERHALHLSPAELDQLTAVVTANMALYDRVDELEAPDVELRHPYRDPGHRPTRAEDPHNAFIRFCRVEGAESGPLFGRTVAIKDCIAVAGVPTTNGGRREPYAVPTEDAVVVERVLDAGATITGKTNMEDLALGLGEGSYFGAARNPRNPRYSTGGSSSGSGAAVAAGMVDMALGADEGGSVRIPAAWCGLVGMKATHGLVPSYGLTYMDHTIDHIGPITATVADNALLLEVIAGGDWRDPQWVRADPVAGEYSGAAARGVEGLRIGVIAESLEPSGCTAGVLASFQTAQKTLQSMGAEVSTVSVPLWTDAQPILMAAINFGLHAMVASGGQGYGHLGRIDVAALAAAAAQSRLGGDDLPPMLKASLVTVDYLQDAYLGLHFGKAQNLRLELRRQIDELFGGGRPAHHPDDRHPTVRPARPAGRAGGDGGAAWPPAP